MLGGWSAGVGPSGDSLGQLTVWLGELAHLANISGPGNEDSAHSLAALNGPRPNRHPGVPDPVRGRGAGDEEDLALRRAAGGEGAASSRK